MSQGNPPGGFSFKFGSNPPRESQTDIFLKTASSPTFPFLHLKIKKDDSHEDSNFVVSVNSKIYDLIKNTLFTDDILLYTTQNQFGNWAYDMIVSMNVLNKLGIFDSFGNWITNSRKCLAAILESKKFEPEFNLKNVKEISRQLLKSMNILEEVNEKEIIFVAAKETYKEKSMDLSTMIYRLAMALFHSNRGAESSLVKALDDPSSTYLVFIKSEIYQKHKESFSEMMDLPLDLRVNVMKVFIAFSISIYAYYNGDLND